MKNLYNASEKEANDLIKKLERRLFKTSATHPLYPIYFEEWWSAREHQLNKESISYYSGKSITWRDYFDIQIKFAKELEYKKNIKNEAIRLLKLQHADKIMKIVALLKSILLHRIFSENSLPIIAEVFPLALLRKILRFKRKAQIFICKTFIKNKLKPRLSTRQGPYR